MKKLFSVILAGVIVAASALSASAGLYVYDSSDEEYWDAALNMLDKEAGYDYLWTEDGAAADWTYAVIDSSYVTELNFEDMLGEGWYEVVLCGLGSTEDEFPADVEGKIALTIRGTSTFETKSTNAMNAGAIACIVGNHGSGEDLDEDGNVTAYSTTNMSFENVTIPTCMVTTDLSARLVAACANVSIAEAVEALNGAANGNETLGLTGTQSAWLYLGTIEEYQANTTRTEDNLGAGVVAATEEATEEVAEEATTEEATEEVAEEVTTEEATEEVVEETTTEEVVEETVVEEATTETVEETVVEEAPQTFDFGVIAAAAAVVSAAGYAISKKHN